MPNPAAAPAPPHFTHRRLLGRMCTAQHARQAALPAKQLPLQHSFSAAAGCTAVAAHRCRRFSHIQRVHLGLQGQGRER